MPERIEHGSPEWWRDRLLQALHLRAQHVDRLEAYYCGNHPIPKPPKSLDSEIYRRACDQYKELASLGVTNFCDLVVSAPADRLAVEGFAFADDADGTRSARAWDIWQRSHLDADQSIGTETALSTGQAYALVSLVDDQAVITLEHPAQTIVAYRAGSRRVREAALKWWADTDMEHIVLYRPEATYRWRRRTSVDRDQLWDNDRQSFATAAGTGGWTQEEEPSENTRGVIPVVELRANPNLRPAPFGGGRSEFKKVVPIQDRINKTVFDRLVTAEFQAFRQRYVIGWQPPEDPETGQPDSMAAYRASVARLQIFNNDDPEQLGNIKAGEYSQADFSGFLLAVEMDVNQMAAITKTPAYLLLGKLVNISSDALIAAEAGLVAKAKRHALNFGESWEEILRLALRAEGDEGARQAQATTVWHDIEQRSIGQITDALVKMKELGVPEEELQQRLPDTTPQDVARWRAMKATEALMTGGTGQATPRELAEIAQKIYLGTAGRVVLTPEESRRIMNQAGAGLGPTPPDLTPPAPAPVPAGDGGEDLDAGDT